MFFTPWLRSFSRRLRLPKRRLKRLSPQQHQKLLRGPTLVSNHTESLEQRCVMTIGPGLVSVTPNAGLFLLDGEIRTEAPRELVFQFSPGHIIDTSTLGAIEIVRSGGDGIFGNGNDVSVSAAYVDALSAAEPNKIVYRFASTPVDDQYRIIVHGTGPGPVLRSNLGVFGDTINDGSQTGADATLNFELDLGAQVVAVVPQPITRIAGALSQATNVIEVYFNDDNLDPALAQNPAFYQLIDTKGTSVTTDDTISLPTGVVYDSNLDRAVLTFASDIPTSTYKLKVGSSLEGVDSLATAYNLGTLFAGSGFTTTAILGDSSAGGGDQDLYRFVLSAGGTVTVTTTPDSALDTVIELLDASGTVIGVPADTAGAGNPETLNSGALLAGTYFVRVTSSGAATTGSYRIEITTTAASPLTTDNNSSYATATDLGVLGNAGKTISAQIETQGFVQIPQVIGASDEPGHRDPVSGVEGSHGGTLGNPANPSTAAVIPYNFAANYGTLFGSPLINQITEGQKARAREMFEVWSRDAGVQFVETANSGIQIIVGDPRAADPTLPLGISVSQGSRVIISHATYLSDETYGGAFMGVLLHEVGHSIGLPHSGDLHSFMVGGGSQPGNPGETLYGDHDAIHIRRLYPQFSTDIDLYRFNVTETGTFSAGVTAELGSTVSLLDSALTLFRDPYARATSEFGTGGAVTMTFQSDSPGAIGNDIRLVLNQSALMSGGVPNVSVSGHVITVTLDTTTPTTAQQLADALNNINPINANNAAAALLIDASFTGAGTTPVTGLASGTVLALGGGNREVIARNDDYNSNDAFLSITLQPGTYYLGVTSTGNTDYDPTISDSGYGGRTQGNYGLQLGFTPSIALANLAQDISTTLQTTVNVVDASLLPRGDSNPGTVDFVVRIGSELLAVTHVVGNTLTVQRGFDSTTPSTYGAGRALVNVNVSALRDNDNAVNNSAPAVAQETFFDGDADGIPGGDFEFWFQSGTTVYVDKATTVPLGSQNGTLAAPYSTIAAGLNRAATRIVAPTEGAGDGVLTGIRDGDIFTITDGTNPTRVFEFDRTDVGGGVNGSNIPISIDPTDTAAMIATKIANAINTPVNINGPVSLLTTATASGDHVDLANLVTLDVKGTNGLLNAPNLVRITANGGTDGNVATEADATPYLIGVDNGGNTLIDGRTFDVPQGVTVMIDAGAVIKLQTANIDVGTDPDVIGPNRQDGALQLLGTPKQSGTANNAVYLTTFRNDAIGGNSDGSSPGAGSGQWGGVIFRRDSDMNDNDVGDLDGGNFFLNSLYQADISYGGGPAPTVFSSIHIVDERPTIAYSRITFSAEAAISANPNAFDDSLNRIGPDIHGNTLTNNSVNGVLVRIQSDANGPADKLDVRARFDDTDVTHVISEQLHITGNAGGAIVANEVQQLDVQGTPTGGFFTLTSVGGTGTASTSLNTPINATQTTFNVADATVLPGGTSFISEFNIRVGTEEMRVTNKVGNTLTVVRGVNGTTPPVGGHLFGTAVSRSRITIPLSNIATAAEIQRALEYINGIGEGNVRVTGGPLTQAPINIEFVNSMGSQNQLGRLSVQNAPLGAVVPLQEGNVVLTRPTAGGVLAARPGGRLQVDPGVVVKLSNARIEGERGSSQLIAEGTESQPVIFTSLKDDRFGGASGTFDTSSNGFNTTTGPSGNTAERANWGGLFFGQGSSISLDNAYVAYGGGNVAIAGGNANFAAVEIHEADGRITNTTFEFNASGADGSARNFRTGNVASVVFVRGAQPVLIDNTFHNNDGAVVSIDVNALRDVNIKDPGRSTGNADIYTEFNNNRGPLVRLNRVENDLAGFNGILGMQVRATEVTTQSVWDDTDIVHVVTGGIISLDNKHSIGGLRLQSASDASLVVKLGAGAGFAIGSPDKNNNDVLDIGGDDGPLEIIDRIGGTMQIIGAPGFPVVLTSIHDDSVGASLDTTGFPQTDTNGNGNATAPAAGNWGEILFDKYAHDRNVVVHLELEKQLTSGIDTNSRLVSTLDNTAENLGNLAPNNKSANENRRAGFQIHGTIAYDDPGDVDIYRFVADAQTEIWLDMDFTDPSLDTIIEFVSSNGTLLARSQGPQGGGPDLTSNGVTALALQKNANLGGDYYTTTIRDAGMRLVTPGAAGTSNTYFIRVRSNPAAGNLNDLSGGLTTGAYQLQVRLGQRDETPGVAVKFADIRYATDGIRVKGLPYHSPLLAEATELGTNDTAGNGQNNDVATPTRAQLLGNLLFSDRGSLGVGGELRSETDIDFYKFHIDAAKIQEVIGINGGPQTWATIIDLDWADGLSRPDTTIAIFRQNGELVYIGRESNVTDDQPAPGQGSDLDDLTRGSVGKQDPYIGTAMFEEDVTNGNEFYYLAVVNNQMQPAALSANFLSGSTQATRARLEPVTSLTRIAEDHIGFQGYSSNGARVDPVTGPLLDIADEISLGSNVTDFDLGDLVLFVSQDNGLQMVNALTGAVITNYGTGLSGGNNLTRDIAMSSDGVLFGYQNVNNTNNTVGRLVRLDTGTAGVTVIGNDNIAGEAPTQQSLSPGLLGAGGGNDFDDITISNNVDAMTIERTGVSGNLPTYVGWYAVNENGRDNVGNTSVNSKLYRANLTTGAVANGGNDSGFGDIQYSGVDYATGTASISNASAGVTILLQAKAPGAAGEGVVFNLNDSGADNGNISVTAGGGVVNVTIGRQVTAQTVVDTVNQNANAREFVTASIINGGNGGISRGTGAGSVIGTGPGGLTGGVDDPTFGVLRGNVTGLAFNTAQPNNSAANLLYGVTSAGELISINRQTPINSSSTRMDATLITDFTDGATNPLAAAAVGGGFTGFTALTLGPQNLHNGLFANTLFATTNTGRLIAFTIGGAEGITLVNAFGSDNETQNITSTATSGTFTLSYTYPLTGEVLTSVPLNFNATQAQVRAALQAMVTSGGLFPFLAADLALTGTAVNTTGINITFQGFYTDKDVNVLSVTNNLTDDAGLTGPLATTVIGGDGLRTQPFVNVGTATGVAFSNLDFNLWHPTFRRGDAAAETVGGADPGHGINTPFDNSRQPFNPETSSQTIQGRTQTESVGGASMYFGLEAYQPGGTTAYLNYAADRSQYGVQNNEYHRDITANVLNAGNPIGNNYNLPGGAYGSMVTNPISLAGYVHADKPTLYFNYFLATQDASAAQGQTSMRDSARVFASTDGGRSWTLIATNNTVLQAELPEFLAHSVDYNGSPVQELFDTGNSGGANAGWRQARIDLSQFASQATVQFRFDFSTAGKINEAGLPGEVFGTVNGTAAAAQQGQNNNHEGFYIDDIIVGFAERGEMVTGAQPDLSTFDNLYSGFAGGRADINLLEEPPTIVATGAYQLEIRRGTEYAAHSDRKDPTGPISVYQTFDTNDRLINDFLTATTPLTDIFDPFTGLNDGIEDFETTGATPAGADWFRDFLGAFPTGGSAAYAYRSGAITTGQQSGVELTVPRAAGQKISFVMAVDAANFSSIGGIPDSRTFNGLKFLIDDVEQQFVISGNAIPNVPGIFDGGAGEADGFIFPGTGSATPAFVSVSFDIPAGGANVKFEWRYVKGVNAATFGTDSAYIDNLVIPQPPSTGRLGDQNVDREQGMVVLEGNFIRNVSGTGIIIEPGDRDSGPLFPTDLPYGGSARQTPVLNIIDPNNDLRLVTHAALVNNVVTNFGAAGIRISGDINAGDVPNASVPLAKVINNTVYGGGTATNGTAIAGTGIVIRDNASPTLINNIVANTNLGIDTTNNATTTQAADISTTLFQNNNNNGTTGNSPIINAGNTSPLFVNAAVGNFYLAAGFALDANEAIDASLNQRFARTQYTAVTNPLGIPAQDQFAPDIDRFGQPRVDDPNTNNALGIFRDLGGIERSDFAGPTANLTTPLDDGDDDLEPTTTVVAIDNPALFTQFIVTLLDVDVTSGRNGIGVDDTGIGLTSGSAFTITQTDITGSRVLVAGTDYFYAYNANTNQAIFTSLTVFPSEARYNILVENNPLDPDAVFDLAGNVLQNNRGDGSTQFDILVTNGVNDAPDATVPATQTTLEDTPITLSVANSNAITITDPDSFLNDGDLQVSLTATNGTLTLPDTPANLGLTLTFNDIYGIEDYDGSDGTLVIRGSLAEINAALDGLIFTPGADDNDPLGTGIAPNDDIRLNFVVNDLGNYWVNPVSGLLDSPQSDAGEIRFIVTPVNDQPIFTLPATFTVDEDEDTDADADTIASLGLGFVTGIGPGPVTADDEVGQTLNFTVTAQAASAAAAAALFATGPAIDPLTGDLTFTLNPNASGSATFDVVLTDSGSNVAPNDNTSITRSFTINVTAVNDAPTLTFGTAATIDEDDGPQTELGFATFDDGDPEIDQTWDSFSITGATSDRGWTQVGPTGAIFSSISFDTTTGDLSYTLMPNVNGTITVTMTVTDGGEFVGPPATSLPLMFTLNVNPVNDQPSVATPTFSHEPVAANAQAGIITPGFAVPTFGPVTAIDETPPADPFEQNVDDYIVSAPATLFGDLAFDVNPDIANDGTLTYTTAAGVPTFGIAVVTVQLRDDGGTALSGVDTSEPLDFYIVVGLANPPVLYNVEAQNVTLILDGTGTMLEIRDSDDFGTILETYALAALNDGLLIRGTSADNVVTFDYSNGDPIPAGIGVILSGSLGSDGIRLVNDASVTSVDYTFAEADRGTILIDNGSGVRSINYIQFEQSVTDTLGAASRSFTYSDINDDVTLADASAAGDGLSTISSVVSSSVTPSSLTVNFSTTAGASLTVNTDTASGAGNDILRVNGYDSTITTASFNGIGGNDLLIGGASGNSFSISGGDSGTLNGATNPFNSFESLQGGAGADSFSFASTAGTISGTIDGQSGSNTLDYSAFGAGDGVTVDLTTGSATNVFGNAASGISNFSTVVGGAGADSLVGSSGNDSLSGGDNDDTLVDGLGDDSLNGGTGNDTYVLTPGSADVLTDGGGTADVLDFSGAAAGIGSNSTPFNLDSGAVQTVFGVHTVQLVGTFENFIGSGFDDFVRVTSNSVIRNVDGGGGNDELIGPDAINTWNITGANAGNIFNTTPVQFLTFSDVENLTGGTQADSFVYADGAFGISGVIDAGTGIDTLSYAAYTVGTGGSVSVVLSASGTGTATNTGGIISFESVVGGAGDDSLTGDTGNDTLIGNGGNDTLTDGLGNDSLNGGDGDDRYMLRPTGSDTVNDSSGSDTVDFSNSTLGIGSAGTPFDLDNVTTAQTVFAGASVRLIGGTYEGFIGSTLNDFVRATVIGSTRTINGNGGTDTLSTGNAANTWHITGPNSGDLTAAGTFDFSNVENLVGGTSTDSFQFSGAGQLAGTINGGTGTDTIDYSPLASAVSVNLGTAAASLLNNGAAGGFTSIESFIGSSAVSSDTLTGPNLARVWNITSTNAGTIDSVPSGTLVTFASFENLTGGTATDTFILANGVGVSGIVNGGTGAGITDTLSYAGYNTPVAINLSTNSATNIGFQTNFESFIGGSAGDTFTGPSLANTWNLTAASTGTISNTGNTLSFSSFETLGGGASSDNFIFAAGSSIGGLNGGQGADTLNLSNLGAVRSVTLTDADVLGFSGTDAAIASGFTGINSIIATALTPDTLTSSIVAPTTWNLGGPTNSVVVNGQTLNFSLFDSFTGGDNGNTFNINGPVTGNLVGGNGDDFFHFSGSGSLNGAIVGNDGNDTLSFGGVSTAQTITLLSADASGYSGTNSLISGGFSGINTLAGGNGADTLIGLNSPSTWTVGTTMNPMFRSYESGGNTLVFSNVENLNGGSNTDTYNISGIQNVNLNGGAGDDAFNFADGASITGSLIGGAHVIGDTVSYAGNTAPVTVNLNNLNTIETVIGGNGNDTLVGLTSGSTFTINALNSGAAGAIAFQDFENLTGSAGADTFNLTDTGVLTGAIDGGLGTDVLSFAAMTNQRTVTLTGSGILDGFQGTENSIVGGFQNINTITGSSSGNDELIGLDVVGNAVATWNIGSTMTYSAGGRLLTFSAFETMTGGTGNDEFTITGARTGNLHGGTGNGLDTYRFSAGATLTGNIDGDAGNDTLSFESYTSAVSVTLNENLPDGYGGIASPIIGGGFHNIDTLIGGTGGDTLNGINDIAAWEVDGTNRYSTPGSTIDESHYLFFIGFENLNGGIESDTFVITGNQTINLSGNDGDDNFILTAVSNLSGTIDGGNGFDTYDLSAKTVAQTISINNLSSIENVVGSLANDTLVGLNTATIFVIDGPNSGTAGTIGFTGFENLQGGTAGDIFEFLDGGSISGTINGGTGSDVLRFTDMSSSQAITLTGLGINDGFAGNVTGTVAGFTNINSLVGSSTGTDDSVRGMNVTSTWTASGESINYTASSRTINLSNVEALLGGTGVDNFTLNATSIVTSIDAGDSNDTINASAATINLTLLGGTGNDTILGGSGDDSIDGGLGTDEMRQTTDNDQTLTDNTATGLGGDTLDSIERALLTGGGSDNTIDASGFTFTATLNGANGNDTIIGGTGNDSINGGDGSDSLSGGDGNDTVDGNNGNNDSVSGGFGNDSLLGGAGTGDRIVEEGFTGTVTLTATALTGTLGSDTLNGFEAASLTADAGNDVINASTFTGSATLDGGAGDDTITGGTGADNLIGGDDNDVLNGKGGNDTLDGGAGNDTLTGDLGNDSIDGGADTDLLNETGNVNLTLTNTSLVGLGTDSLSGIENAILTGGTGNNTFNAAGFSAGSVTLFGAAGNDSLLGGSQSDSLDGGAGNDTLRGNGSNDTIRGGAGADSLDGGDGNDDLNGQADNDTILGGNANDTITGELGSDSLDGGLGTDRLVETANVNLTLTATQLTGLGTDKVLNFESAVLTGGAGNNAINATGFAGAVSLFGLGGNDTLTGGNASDLLEGGDGNDQLSGGLGNDTLDGGDGTDTVLQTGIVNATLTNTTLVGVGNDVLIVMEAAKLTTGATNSTINASAFDGPTTLTGGAGNDSLIGGTGNDSINGGSAGKDTIRGGDGNDTLDGGAGGTTVGTVPSSALASRDDIIHGDAGNDSIKGQGGNDFLFGEEGNDTIDGGAGNDVIDGGDGNDNLVGGTQNDAIRGGLGNDTLNGNDGNDSILGSAGNDSILGGNGNDLLRGEDDNDTLSGQGGTDKLDGGAGANKFLSTSGDSTGDFSALFSDTEFDALIASIP